MAMADEINAVTCISHPTAKIKPKYTPTIFVGPTSISIGRLNLVAEGKMGMLCRLKGIYYLLRVDIIREMMYHVSEEFQEVSSFVRPNCLDSEVRV